MSPIPWVSWVWALSFLTVLAPSERYHQKCRRSHKKLTDWARQVLVQVRRWVPQRGLIVVADSSFAMLTLLDALRHLARPVTMTTRLRLDAALYEPAPERLPNQTGCPRLKGNRLPTHCATGLARDDHFVDQRNDCQLVSRAATGSRNRLGNCRVVHTGMPPVPIRWVVIRDPQNKFRPQALLSTEVMLTPTQIVTWFVQRWQRVETQRQWADLAIIRTTPTLLGLFSVVTLLAHALSAHQPVAPRQAAWYAKSTPTFAEALALVRSHLWRHTHFSLSYRDYDLIQIPRPLFECLTDTLCYAS